MKMNKSNSLKSSSIVAVQTTNDSSLLSKHSMVAAGYFSDPYINEFVNASPKGRTSLINRGYYVRAKSIETSVLSWLSFCQSNFEKYYQIISLGAGFDTLYFRLQQNEKFSSNIRIFEVDYHDVVTRKAKLIENSSLLASLLSSRSVDDKSKTGNIALETSSYNLIGVDLKHTDNLTKELIACEIDFSAPTLLLSECAITYMRESDSSKLIQWASTSFENATFLTYEQICPDDGFGQVMVNHFRSTGSPLLSVGVFKTAKMQQSRYLDLGWSVCDVIDMNTFYQCKLTLEERDRISHLELFEEFEEFHQKCAHYVLITASKGALSKHRSNLCNEEIKSYNCQTFEITNDGSISNVNRYGHRSELLMNRFIITIGGYGVSSDRGHKRLTNICVSDIESKTNIDYVPQNGFMKDGIMFHSLSPIDDRTVMLFGGRTSPVRAFGEVYFVRFDGSLEDVNSWQTEFERMETKSDPPCARWRHSATSVVINGKLKVVIYGGRTASHLALGDCFSLNVESLEWTSITPTNNCLPTPCHSHAACPWGTKIVISGGLNSDSQPSNSVYILDCKTSQWCQVKSVGLLPRYSHTSLVWKDKLYVIGGVTTEMISPGIGILDLNSGYCLELSLPISRKPVLLCKHSHVFIPEEEAIIILGGGGNCFSFGSHFNNSTMKVKLKELEKLFKN